MRRTRERQPAQLVGVTLMVDKATLALVDAAARTLEVDRVTVLLRGFDLLTYATAALYGHYEHLELAGVS